MLTADSCTGKYGEEFRNKFEDLPQKEIADWFKNTFSGWSMKCEEKPDKVTADRIEYGRVLIMTNKLVASDYAYIFEIRDP